MEHYELIVIGSGPAGSHAAIQGAKLGRSVLVVENRLRVGGVSVHTGTIPSKTLRETVLNLSGWRERRFYGLTYRVKKDINGKDLGARLHMALDYEIDALEHQFARHNVRTSAGMAQFLAPHIITVYNHAGEEKLFHGEKLVIAVGTTPSRPPHIPFDDYRIVDSDSLAVNPRVPRSLTVAGAGVIGIEYAAIYSALDVPVTIVEPRNNFLEFVDREIIEEFVHDLRCRGVQLRLGASVQGAEIDVQGQTVSRLSDGRILRSDMLLFAAGRKGATGTLALDKSGLDVDERGRLRVDPRTYQTRVPHIYAAGDVIGFPSLASTAMEQGRMAASHALSATMPQPAGYSPHGVYAVPEISAIGLTEQDVRDKGIPYECGIARFRETSRGRIMGLQSGMMKMIFALDDGKLLGVHIVGEGATELIHIGQAVLNFGGTLDYFIDSTFNHPTLAETYKIAALDAFNRMPNERRLNPSKVFVFADGGMKFPKLSAAE
jgi:NAD(P) transhydrogenase